MTITVSYMMPGEKQCAGECGKIKPYAEFYIRSGYGTADNTAYMDGHFTSECKACMRKRGRTQKRLPPWESRVLAEQLAIDYLMAHGIWAQTGKATSAPDVDVVAWGCVWIEIKYSKLDMETGGRSNRFTFTTTPSQRANGFRGHIVMLICDYGDDELTHHFFHGKEMYFYGADGRMKTGITFTPDSLRRSASGKRGHRPLTQEIMDTAQDNYKLVLQWHKWIATDLWDGERPIYGKPFANG